MTEAIEVGWFGPAHGCWAWVQDHFHCVRMLDEREFDNWLEPIKGKRPEIPRVLFAVLEHRSDSRLSAMHRVTESASLGLEGDNARIACLLGSDWQGHRRTHPLPEKLETFYWFQLYDRTLPWVIRHARSDQQEQRPTRRRPHSKPESPSPTNPRVQRILDQSRWHQEQLAGLATQNAMAWIVTDTMQQRNVWEDVLAKWNVRTVSSRLDASDPWCNPELIVFDAIARDAGSTESLSNRIVEVRRNHPDAFLVLVDPFPIWERWQSWIEMGVNAVLPRPVQVEGVLVVWQRWLQQQASAASIPIF